MLNLLSKLFYINVEGLGWKILFYVLIILIPIFFWFKENRYKYESFSVKTVTADQFTNLMNKIKVELQYESKDLSMVKRTWIFGSNDFQSKISLFEYNPNSKTASDFSPKAMEKSYNQINRSIILEPGTFVAFNLTTTEGFPEYRVKIEMNGMIAWINIHDQLRYNVNGQNRIEFKQTFISFLKNKISE